MISKFPKIKAVLCIQNYGISGTTLMHSLLDTHPEFLCLPSLYGREFYEFWDAEITKEAVIPRTLLKDAISKFTDAHKHYFNLFNCPQGMDKMGENKDKKIEINKDFFVSKLEDMLQGHQDVNRKDFLLAIYVAFNEFYKIRYNYEVILVFPIHSLPRDKIDYLIKDFSNVKVLHVVREPVQNMGSLMKHVVSMTESTSFTFAKGLLNCALWQVLLEKSLHWSLRGTKCYGKFPYYKDSKHIESRSIRLEDIHLNSKQTLQKVCDWLGVKWNDCLLKSTYMGLLWHNRPESVEQQGIGNKTITQKYSKFMFAFDRFRLKVLSVQEQKYFGYVTAKEAAKLSLYIPFMLILMLVPFKAGLLKSRFKQQKVVGRSKIIFPDARIITAALFGFEFGSKTLGKINRIFVTIIILIRNLANYFTLRVAMIYKIIRIIFAKEQKNYVVRL